ncbi:MAG: hypothetical protein JRH20_07440 [Deltaproteobacteria bacterium]|nr:hypothetical protein [Deltaproteobacteria bacterium]
MPKVLIRLCMGCGGLFSQEIDAHPAECPHCGHDRNEIVDASRDTAQAMTRIEQLSGMCGRANAAQVA